MITERKNKVAPVSPHRIKEQERIEKLRAKRRRGLARRLAVFFIFTVIAAAVMTSVAASRTARLDELQERRTVLKNKLARLEQKEKSLRQQVKNLHDLDYIGEIARREWYMSEKGEIIFTTPSDSAN